MKKLRVGDVKKITHQYGGITGLVYKEIDGFYAIIGINGRQNIIALNEIISIENVKIGADKIRIMKDAQRIDKEIQKSSIDVLEYERVYVEELRKIAVKKAEFNKALEQLEKE